MPAPAPSLPAPPRRRRAAPGRAPSPSPRAVVAALALALAGAVAGCADDLGPPRRRAAPTPDAPDGRALLDGIARSPRLASYRLDARFDAGTRQVDATGTLTWRNAGQTAVDAVPLHLYMNAFKNERSLLMRTSRGEHRGNSFSGRHWGWIDVASIRVDGQELRGDARRPNPDDPDETVLEVPLRRPVAPGETLVMELTWKVQLPEVFSRTGFHGPFTMVAQWFPKVGVRVGPPGQERWQCAPMHVDSEFFADFGVYDVALTVPDTLVVGATGVLVEATDHDDGTRTLRYRAEDVHDFAWTADPYFEELEGVARAGDRDVTVRVLHRPAQRAFARRHLAAGIGAIEQLSAMLLPYPWPVMTIVDPPLGADGAAGMEYPTLVTTAGDGWYAADGVRLPELVTIHEIGHNWFQGMIASDEGAEAWLDEGVNDWAVAEVIARLYGEPAGLVDWLGISLDVHRAARAGAAPQASIPSPIATASWAFVDSDAYGAASYTRTALALKTLENLVGRAAFLEAMRRYAVDWAFRHPTGEDFFASLSASVGQDLAWYRRAAFEGTGAADFAVRTARCVPAQEPRGVFDDPAADGGAPTRRLVLAPEASGALRCEVVVVNRGELQLPVDLELRFADRSVTRHRWVPDGRRWHRLEFDRSAALTEVVIDPDRQVLLADAILDDHLRLVPDAAAAWRAGARLGFWTQGLMQGVGL